MNAPHFPTEAIPATREHELAVLCERILSGASDERLEWRTLEWLPGYEVSDYGHLRRCEQKRNFVAGRVIKPWVGAGYVRYGIGLNGKKMQVMAHRLVCEAWHGPPPFAGAQVAHADADPINNHHSNVRWATAQANSNDKVLQGRRFAGENVHTAKLTLEDVRVIRSLRTKVSQSALARRFGVSPGSISAIHTLRTWPLDLTGITEVEACLILALGYSSYVDFPLYSADEWRFAAQAALDGNDYSELTFMMMKEAWYQQYRELSDREQDGWQGFENYFDARRKARVFRTMEAGNLLIGQVCADIMGGCRG